MADGRLVVIAEVSGFRVGGADAGPFDDLADKAAVLGRDAYSSVPVGVGNTERGRIHRWCDDCDRRHNAGSQRGDEEHCAAGRWAKLSGLPEGVGGSGGNRRSNARATGAV